MLLLAGREDPTGKHGMGAKWVTMDESDPNYELMYANHKQMVEQVLSTCDLACTQKQLGYPRVNEQTCGIHESYTLQVREKELTHLRAGLLMTVVKWGKVELFEKVVNDSNFADQRSPALVQQVYAWHTLGIHVHRSRCLQALESPTSSSPPSQAFQLGLKLAGNTKQFDVKARTHIDIAYTLRVRRSSYSIRTCS